MTYPRSKYSPSKGIEAKKKRAVPSSANIIHMCLSSVLAGRGKGKGKEGGGEGNYQVVISRATIISSFNTSTVKLTDTMRLKWSRPTRIWERPWIIPPMGFR